MIYGSIDDPSIFQICLKIIKKRKNELNVCSKRDTRIGWIQIFRCLNWTNFNILNENIFFYIFFPLIVHYCFVTLFCLLLLFSFVWTSHEFYFIILILTSFYRSLRIILKLIILINVSLDSRVILLATSWKIIEILLEFRLLKKGKKKKNLVNREFVAWKLILHVSRFFCKHFWRRGNRIVCRLDAVDLKKTSSRRKGYQLH